MKQGDDAKFQKPSQNKLQSLVLDSGPIIKGGCLRLINSAESFWTIEEVLNEIRDSKARHHLETLPFELRTRCPTPESIHFVTEFARKTGDLQSLSRVDLRVLALTYMLEYEANGTAHLRSEPLRKASKLKSTTKEGRVEGVVEQGTSGSQQQQELLTHSPLSPSPESTKEDHVEVDEICSESDECEEEDKESVDIQQDNESSNPAEDTDQYDDAEDDGGQFDDADSDVEGVTESTKAVTFEEAEAVDHTETAPALEEEEDFPTLGDPSLKASTAVSPTISWGKASEVLKSDKSGGAWARTSKLVTKETVIEAATGTEDGGDRQSPESFFGQPSSSPAAPQPPVQGESPPLPPPEKLSSAASKSKIIGFGGGAVNSLEDDGQGWINPTNINAHRMQGGGLTTGKGKGSGAPPPLKTKAGCATTDYAMQNVLVQIGLPLLSVDGMVVRRVKQWVLRCQGCFKITQDMEKLFCPVCGGNTLQKVSVSIDSKTGYTRLHLRKNRKNNLRGSKFNLPAPGKADRFQGELLLREDQLKMGIWKQKASRSKKNVSSAFGEDITQNFGMNINKSPDIVVGFGRKNPNQMKGRERRGKKKKR